MPLSSTIVGRAVGAREVLVTTRACLAYAAGTNDATPCYWAEDAEGGIIAPPMWGVTLDWPLRPDLTTVTGLAPAETARGVHATQDMTFHRPVRPGDRLRVRGTVVQVTARRAGAYLVTRYDTEDEWDAPVLTTYYGSVLRGVQVSGDDRTDDAPPPLPAMPPMNGTPLWAEEFAVLRSAPHIYTECADIYNPIHTERTAALAAGLPDIIVHGTLTLAYAVSRLIQRSATDDPTRLLRVSCGFGGIVIPGTTIRVECEQSIVTPGGHVVAFRVRAADGAPAIRQGIALFGPPSG